MPTKTDCSCRFSNVEAMSESEKQRYVDKTRCSNCGKIKFTRKPTTDAVISAPAQDQVDKAAATAEAEERAEAEALAEAEAVAQAEAVAGS